MIVHKKTMHFFRPFFYFLTFIVFILFLISLYLAINQETDFPGYQDLVTSLPDFPTNSTLPFRHYSGYLTPSPNTSIFYWLFESQGQPTDPVVVFLNGGPGCSSLLGAFGEVGPIQMNKNETLTLNPYSWNTRAHLLFLEVPAGVGFSKISGFWRAVLNYITDDFTITQLNMAVLRAFFAKFPHLLANSFYLTGKAYAGRYIALLAELILKHSYPPKFKGIALGNPYLLHELAHESQKEFMKLHGIADYSEKKQPNSTKVWLFNIQQQCTDFNFPDSFGYFVNYSHFHKIVPQHEQSSCWVDSALTWWLGKVKVQKAIHAVIDHPVPWKPCNHHSLIYNQMHDKQLNLKSLFEHFAKSIKVLLFSGDTDFVNNLIRTKWFIDTLQLKLLSKDEPLYFKENQTGLVYRYESNFTFVFVHLFNAGALSPADQPGPTLKMLHKFLLNE